MAKKIVGLIRPFALKQNIYIYEDGNKLVSASPKLTEINNTIFSLADEYEVTKVDLVGPKQYVRGLIKKMQEEEMQRYKVNKLELNVI